MPQKYDGAPRYPIITVKRHTNNKINYLQAVMSFCYIPLPLSPPYDGYNAAP